MSKLCNNVKTLYSSCTYVSYMHAEISMDYTRKIKSINMQIKDFC